MERLNELYRSRFGSYPFRTVALPASGSRRRYFRIEGDGGTVIGAIGTDIDENRAFTTIARHFRSRGINVPEVYGVSPDGFAYIQEDLGTTSLYEAVSGGRERGYYSPAERGLLVKAVAGLPKIQFEGARGLDFGVCYPDKEFNSRMVDFDLNYFKYCFLKTTGTEFNETALQDDFDLLKEDLLNGCSDTFMYRDFQARNVMMRDGEPWYIDFQGGRRGPAMYDIASFVWQAKARYPEDLRQELIDAYLDALAPYSDISGEEFRSELRVFVLFRTLQVLGAYGFRGRFEGKSHFLESIPYALENLSKLISTPFGRYPYLCDVLRRVISDRKETVKGDGSLEVHVLSFSYRKGIPEDGSGNGGGYIFDCRGMHNPGRYERYKDLTGRDPEVIAFLEGRGEVQGFLDNVFKLVDPHVERFISRGFTHLQVAFGCTGGQHRSVYCAEAAARHLKERYNVTVKLTHREQGTEVIL